MIDQPQQFDDTGEYVDKAKDHAQQNPDRARSVIDKIEDFVDEKTGGKYSAQVDRAGDFIEGQLGLPNNTNNPLPQDPTVPTDPEAPNDPVAPTDPATPVDPDGATDAEMRIPPEQTPPSADPAAPADA